MLHDFLNLCIFSFFVISVKNRLISDYGGFFCCRVISEMQHTLETRLPFYKWRCKYLLNLSDRMTMMKGMPLKVEWSNKISPLLDPYFYNINTFNAPFQSQFSFIIILMTCSCFGCVVVYLKYDNICGNLVPTALNFFYFSVNKKIPWVHYCLCGANFCLESPFQVTLQRQYLSLLLWSCYFLETTIT